MKVISKTIEYNGSIYKLENGKVFTWAFGTTVYRKNQMHWSLVEIPIDKLKPELQQIIKEVSP